MNQVQLPIKNHRLARRRSAKPGLRVKCLKGTMGIGKNLAVGILDISETGVRLVISADLEKNQDIELEFMMPQQSKAMKVIASVSWCVALLDGTYCIGAAFKHSLSYSDFSVIAQFSHN
ncbi:PilZ domain-containing protein [Telmatocola sphagniphila]|jgi:hypothetical protein|uniref:PilZ domain-containing protein n=1 Tax=Telmatocola sphagniphila TaxID=1123043 RepID=A0A8E6B806_9BACT|nr:PilZ domain-containing protein [Telmatocola sphagniphila]QVL33179.1 PilZ domain-containing protein [Telmatocola sphagniphila]